MIDCHIIFNKPTDREDWLERCVESLRHDDVMIRIHRFTESAPVCPRRYAIIQAHDPSHWIMFADPDDYAVQPGYDNFVSFLQGTDAEVATSLEENTKGVIIGGHHFVALRGESLKQVTDPERPYETQVRDAAVCREVAYFWNLHPGSTRGCTHDN